MAAQDSQAQTRCDCCDGMAFDFFSEKIENVHVVTSELLMTLHTPSTSKSLERFKELIPILQKDSSSSADHLRQLKELEDFDRRLQFVESSYAQAYEQVQKLESAIDASRQIFIHK